MNQGAFSTVSRSTTTGASNRRTRERHLRGTGRGVAGGRAYRLEPATPVVIFSDHHKGGRDGADDFQRCKRTYNEALTCYSQLGWHLIELGDVEELWENTFDEVVSNYPVTLELAARFQQHAPAR
jgi:hypothetical protein